MRQSRGKGEKHGGKLSDGKPGCGNRDGRFFSFLQVHGSDEKDAPYPEQLLGKLRCSGNTGFPDTVKIAVDAGVDGGKGEGQRRNAQKRGASGFK